MREDLIYGYWLDKNYSNDTIYFYDDGTIESIQMCSKSFAHVDFLEKDGDVTEDTKNKVEDALYNLIDLSSFSIFTSRTLYDSFDKSGDIDRCLLTWKKVEKGLITDCVQIELYETGELKTYRHTYASTKDLDEIYVIDEMMVKKY